jgi:hypothetical protein
MACNAFAIPLYFKERPAETRYGAMVLTEPMEEVCSFSFIIRS